MSGSQTPFILVFLIGCGQGSPEVDIDGRWIVEEGRFPWQDETWASAIEPQWGDLQTLDGSPADCWEGPVAEAQQALHYGPEYSGERFEHWVSFVAQFPCGEEAARTRIEGQRDLGVPAFRRNNDGEDEYRLDGEAWSFRSVEDGVLELDVSGTILTLRKAG